MTTWLEFRSEPSVTPEVKVTFPEDGSQPFAECSLCDWIEGVTNEADAESAKYWHLKWHEDGMPE